MSTISLSDIQKIIDQNMVIEIPSLEVRGGEIAAVLGPMDSGKEGLFQLLTGGLRPTSGSLRVAGIDPYTERQAFSRRVGVVFAEHTLYKRLSVQANLQFFSRLYQLPKERVFEVMQQVDLLDQMHTLVDKLSPALCRRLALGRVLLHQPQVLLLAEPFAGCDPASIKLITQVLRQQGEAGTAILVFVQDAVNLETFCQRVYRLVQGRISEIYDPRAEQSPQQPFMIPARGEDKIILVDPADILYIFARNDRACLQTAERQLPTQFTLTEIEKRLARHGFFRAHRAYLVNLQQVKEVIPYTRDSFTLRLKDTAGTEIPLSKSAERELRELLGY